MVGSWLLAVGCRSCGSCSGASAPERHAVRPQNAPRCLVFWSKWLKSCVWHFACVFPISSSLASHITFHSPSIFINHLVACLLAAWQSYLTHHRIELLCWKYFFRNFFFSLFICFLFVYFCFCRRNIIYDVCLYVFVWKMSSPLTYWRLTERQRS